MRANLEATGGLLMTAVAAGLAGALGRVPAQEMVRRLSRTAADSGRPLGECWPTTQRRPEAPRSGRPRRRLDPERYLGSAGYYVDLALADHRAPRRERRP